ncbi:hypothetical protein PG990_007495 [Apiospora arundinis]
MAGPRRRKMIGHRRRVEDEGEDELDLDDDSLTDGSLASDDDDHANDSDTSNVDEASPTSPATKKSAGEANGQSSVQGNGTAKVGVAPSAPVPGPGTDKSPKSTSLANGMSGLSISDQPVVQESGQGDDTNNSASPSKSGAPIVVSSAIMDQPQDGQPTERRRREHDEYRRRRDEDPSFVPNRGAFFMHDHRHAGPSANGFRPFGRGGRGRGRGGGIGGPFAPFQHQVHNTADPTVSAPWAHDMHEVVTEPAPSRQPRHTVAHIRVFLPQYKEPVVFAGHAVKQYTRLPDHRPPLRRDKPVRISLPNFPPRYIFPATDRSFIFIPRAMRPNQQRLRGKPRSGLGSIGGFSRRTSVFGGSYYNGSVYSPSVALSRRSSIAPDMGRDYLLSPTGSAISRAPMPLDAARPVVRLPPRVEPPPVMNSGGMGEFSTDGAPANGQTTINDLPQPQIHPLPQKPQVMQENKHASIPMHQPKPQKTVSVETIESPAMHQNSQSYQQAFHHQVPVHVSNGFGHDPHARHPSYASTGTPLSQIPERAIHAAPFQPTQYAQQGYAPQYQMMPPQQHGYYYPPQGPYAAPAPPFVPGAQQPQPQGEMDPSGQGAPGSSLVAQEVNGMVYYYDASQMPPPVQSYPPYSAPQVYPGAGGVMGMNGVAPPPDGYYYPHPGNGTVYYPQ